jgi:hypothetical protein
MDVVTTDKSRKSACTERDSIVAESRAFFVQKKNYLMSQFFPFVNFNYFA